MNSFLSYFLKQFKLSRDNSIQIFFFTIFSSIVTLSLYYVSSTLPAELTNIKAIKWITLSTVICIGLIISLKHYLNFSLFISISITVSLAVISLFVFYDNLFYYGVSNDNKPTIIVFYPDDFKSSKFETRTSNAMHKLPDFIEYKNKKVIIKSIPIPFSGLIEKSLLGKRIESFENIVGYIEVIEDGMFLKSTFSPLKPYIKLGITDLTIKTHDFPEPAFNFTVNFSRIILNFGLHREVSPVSHGYERSLTLGTGLSNDVLPMNFNNFTTEPLNSIIDIEGKHLSFSIEESIYHILSSYLQLQGDTETYCKLIENKLRQNFHDDVLPYLTGKAKENILNCLSQIETQIIVSIWPKLRLDKSLLATKSLHRYLLASNKDISKFSSILKGKDEDFALMRKAISPCWESDFTVIDTLSCILNRMVLINNKTPFDVSIAKEYLSSIISYSEDTIFDTIESYYTGETIHIKNPIDYYRARQQQFIIEDSINQLGLTELSCPTFYYLIPLIDFEKVEHLEYETRTINILKDFLISQSKKNSSELNCPINTRPLEMFFEQNRVSKILSISNILSSAYNKDMEAKDFLRWILSIAAQFTAITEDKLQLTILNKAIESSDDELKYFIKKELYKQITLALGEETSNELISNYVAPLLESIFYNPNKKSFMDILITVLENSEVPQLINKFIQTDRQIFLDYTGKQFFYLFHLLTQEDRKVVPTHPYKNEIIAKIIQSMTVGDLDIPSLEVFLEFYPEEKNQPYVKHIYFKQYIKTGALNKAKELMKFFLNHNSKKGFYQYVMQLQKQELFELCGHKVKNNKLLSESLLDININPYLWSQTPQYFDDKQKKLSLDSIEKFEAMFEIYLILMPLDSSNRAFYAEATNCKLANQ